VRALNIHSYYIIFEKIVLDVININVVKVSPMTDAGFYTVIEARSA
jgi:hypothetical protein